MPPNPYASPTTGMSPDSTWLASLPEWLRNLLSGYLPTTSATGVPGMTPTPLPPAMPPPSDVSRHDRRQARQQAHADRRAAAQAARPPRMPAAPVTSRLPRNPWFDQWRDMQEGRM